MIEEEEKMIKYYESLLGGKKKTRKSLQKEGVENGLLNILDSIDDCMKEYDES